MKKIIIAPLNWGLGHASRCVPIIKYVQKAGFIPVIASDGKALTFLKNEFPKLQTFELPSYHISYGRNLKWSLFLKLFSIRKAVREERNIIENALKKDDTIVGIISDNRFGCFSKNVHSVYITHQLNVLSGFTTPITSWVHRQIIRKFDECWVPDEKNSCLSGRLSKNSKLKNIRFIGAVSRFQKCKEKPQYDYLILLFGPEPRRTLLENKLISIFNNSNKIVNLVRGVVEETVKIDIQKNLTITNFLNSEALEKEIAKSKVVICRAGYSSILDLVKMQKEAILIPTKGQNEQEYLAKFHGCFLDEHKLSQEDFTKRNIVKINNEVSELPSDLLRFF